MTLRLNEESILASVEGLKSLAKSAVDTAFRAHSSAIGNTYSAQSDYSHMGQERGNFISGGLGSANDVLTSFTEQVDWLHNNLSRNADVLFGQEEFNKRWLSISDEGGSANYVTHNIPPRPKAMYNDIMMLLPLPLPEEPHTMSAKLAMSQDAQAAMAGAQWGELAAKVGQISMGLTNIANQIEAANEGQVIESMIPVFREIAEQGSNFAINAISMVSDLGDLVASRNRVDVSTKAAVAEIDLAATPEAKAAVTAMKTAQLYAQRQTEMHGLFPAVNNLMGAPTSGVSLAQAIEIGQGLVDGNGKLNTDGLGAIGPSISRVAQAIAGGGDFNKVAEGSENYAGTRSASDVATQTASAGPSALANAVNTPAVAGNNASAGVPATGAASAGNVASGVQPANGLTGMATQAAGTKANGAVAKRMGVTPNMGMVGAPGTASSPGSPRAGTVSKTSGTMDAPHRGASVANARTGGRAVALGGGPGFGSSGMSPVGYGAGAMRGPASSVGGLGAGGLGSGVTAAAAGGAPSAVGAGPAAGARMGTPMMGGMPVGAPGGSRNGRGKVKRITSAVEVDDNVAALIGKRPGMVPGVIGAWVRD